MRPRLVLAGLLRFEELEAFPYVTLALPVLAVEINNRSLAKASEPTSQEAGDLERVTPRPDIACLLIVEWPESENAHAQNLPLKAASALTMPAWGRGARSASFP